MALKEEGSGLILPKCRQHPEYSNPDSAGFFVTGLCADAGPYSTRKLGFACVGFNTKTVLLPPKSGDQFTSSEFENATRWVNMPAVSNTYTTRIPHEEVCHCSPGQRGVAPQVLAVTTNGTSGNQTFGITFGTSGCTQDGVVSSSWKTAMYIDGNRVALARDAAAGQGESLDTLAAVMGVKDADRALFTSTVKRNFGTVFANEQIAANLKSVLTATPELNQYAAAI